MNALEPISFASAYRQLRPAQKAFVDRFVADAERDANSRGERISNVLYRAITPAVVEASHGMLENPIVRAAIAERINQLATATELSIPRLVKELMAIGFASIGDYMSIGEDGQPYFDLSSATPEQLSAIKSIKIEETGDGGFAKPTKRKFEFVLHDKVSVLRTLSDMTGLSNPDNPFWRAENARPVGERTKLQAGTTADEAANAYANLING